MKHLASGKQNPQADMLAGAQGVVRERAASDVVSPRLMARPARGAFSRGGSLFGRRAALGGHVCCR